MVLASTVTQTYWHVTESVMFLENKLRKVLLTVSKGALSVFCGF